MPANAVAQRGCLPELGEGGTELLTGVAEALTVHSTIQLALGMIMGRAGITSDEAYLNLRLRAVDSGTSLLATADAIIRGDL
jgi:AmiR/NasT family two-component response regulator